MILTQQEMRRRADEFSESYKDVSDERSYAQQYWRDFFNIFNVHWKDVAVFEQAVKKFNGSQGFIDCFWKGKLVIEHKSRGKNLFSAFTQALGYLDTLSALEKPRYIIVSDFYRIRLIDLYLDKKTEITLDKLSSNIQLFSFIYEDGIEHHQKREELNIEAAELMGQLHDSLKSSGYDGRDLELLLIRLLFCVYAENTNIFSPYYFSDYITNEQDPTTVGTKIQMLFRILNQNYDERQNNLPKELSIFPYVNGKLFEEPIVPPNFDYRMYGQLKKICRFDWSTISPAIFGSLFQSIMDEDKRRNLGAHYTSESNVLKVINSLFMNNLWNEFYKSKKNYRKLELLREKIGELKLFDPACGCGNFLIIAYRELRLLEYEILSNLLDEDKKQSRFSPHTLTNIKLDNFYGIEIEEFPSLIAKVAMWFIEHQMDLKYETLNIHRNNLPLKTSANIVNGNALLLDWKDLLKPTDDVFILGNPPFSGKKDQTKSQKEEMKIIFKGFKKIGVLDYVTAWYKKSLDYIENTKIQVTFVSTSSIIQGEQVSALWKPLKKEYNVKFNFAHKPFKWKNEAKNNATVSVVIIGFSCFEKEEKYIFKYDYSDIPKGHKADNINHYLFDSKDIIIDSLTTPISNVPKIQLGNMPNDGGNLILSPKEYKNLINKYPSISKYLKQYVGGKEFIKGTCRYCIWAVDEESIFDLRKIPEISERFDNVKKHRLNSTREKTRELAEFPYLFGEIRQPKNNYIVVPLTTASSREYIPLGFMDKDIIISNSVSFIDSDDLFLFGILNSKMHMTWMRYIAGRLGDEYRYSNNLVYNNFPFPENVLDKQNQDVISKVKTILDIRNKFDDKSLFDLYTDEMPYPLKKAHIDLDKAVDKCYRSTKFKDDNDRMNFLFKLYSEHVN